MTEPSEGICLPPCFFIVAMWFAWLLRTDARVDAALDDPEAQREFVVWWLLYGQAEYPAVWWFGPEQVAVAMEPVMLEGFCLPRLVRRLYKDRHDIRAAFPLRDVDSVGDLLCWYRLSGPVEACVAPVLPADFLNLTESPSGRLPWTGAPEVPRMAVAFHARLSDLQRRFDPVTGGGRSALVRWYATSGNKLIPDPTPLPEWPEPPYRCITGPGSCDLSLLVPAGLSSLDLDELGTAEKAEGRRLRPRCFTVAMWFAWLLRTDARAGAALDDPEAQREFAVWWLLYGQAEYPAVWWFGPEQVAVAMEPVMFDGFCLPRLVRRLYQDRQDIRVAFPLRDTDSVGDFLCWYRLSGPIETSVAPVLPADFVNLTESPSGRPPWNGAPGVPRMAVAFHARRSDLKRRFDPMVDEARTALVRWYTTPGNALIPDPTPLPEWAERLPPCRNTLDQDPGSLGVNLVGFARAEFGIGEDVRSVSRALELVGFRHVIVDVEAMPYVRTCDESRSHLISAATPYAANIFCMSPFDTAGLFLKRGPDFFAGKFNIGYWPWELAQFPEVWGQAFDLVDEVWAATRFQLFAYRGAGKTPVFLMPPAVLRPDSAELIRAAPHRRRPRKFRFIYPFDPNSSLSRKNPVVAIRAFRRAFPASDRAVELVLRVNGKTRRSAEWRSAWAAAQGDTRIIVISGTMHRAAALALIRSADCLVSTHRTEGFGRNIAEAVALGVPVLATGGSGPDDFLRRGERVASRPVRVGPGEYPFAEGLWWRDPVVADVAQKMRSSRVACKSTKNLKIINRQRIFQHSPRTVGANYVQQLTHV